MSYQIGQNIRIKHPLKDLIYGNGYSIAEFSRISGINVSTFNDIFAERHKVRKDTKEIIANSLNVSLEVVKMQLNEKIDEMYRQYNTTKCKKTKKQLYKAIKRAEGKRRKEKIGEMIVI